MPEDRHLNRRSLPQDRRRLHGGRRRGRLLAPHGTDTSSRCLTRPRTPSSARPIFYRTVCQECPAGCGITAKSREGRVIKLEGNPDHPINRGSLCARGQAALQGLYAPDRLRQPMRRGPGPALTAVSWDTALGEIAVRLNESLGSSQGIVLLGRSQPGSEGALQEALGRVLGESGDRLVYEPFDPAALRAASRAAFGLEEIPVFRLDPAQLILSLGADFLETWPSPVEHARQLRDARSAPGGRARLVFVGPQLSLSAASADLWLPALPETEGAIALALCKQVLQAESHVPLPADLAAHLRAFLAGYDAKSVEQLAHLPDGSLDRLAKELIAARSSVVLPPGPLASGAGATSASLAVLLLNYLLGNCGRTVLYGQDPLLDTPSSLCGRARAHRSHDPRRGQGALDLRRRSGGNAAGRPRLRRRPPPCADGGLRWDPAQRHVRTGPLPPRPGSLPGELDRYAGAQRRARVGSAHPATDLRHPLAGRSLVATRGAVAPQGRGAALQELPGVLARAGGGLRHARGDQVRRPPRRRSATASRRAAFSTRSPRSRSPSARRCSTRWPRRSSPPGGSAAAGSGPRPPRVRRAVVPPQPGCRRSPTR